LFNLEPSVLISRIIVLLVAFTIHEFAHAWTATQFGDDTPRLYGRLSLNPMVHLDPMGSLMLIFAGFGWAKPVPVNPYALEKRSSSALLWVSLAGPMSNFLLAILAAIPFKLGMVSISGGFSSTRGIIPTPAQFLVEFISINLILMLFNMIPLAPLDGEKIIVSILPPNMAQMWDGIRPYGPIILIVIAIVLPMFGIDLIGKIIYPPLQALFRMLVG